MRPSLGALEALSARGNALVWVLLVAVVALAVALLAVFRAFQSAAESLIHERDQQVVFLSAARLGEALTKPADVLAELAVKPDLHSGTASRRRAALRAAALELGVFDGGIVLLDNFGRVQETLPARPGILGADWSDRDFFRAQLSSPGVVLSDINDDGPGRSPVVALSVPLENADGAFVGVLAGLYRLDQSAVSSLYAGIVRLRLGQSGDTFVVDGAGRAVYSSGPWETGAPLATIGPPVTQELGRPGTLRTRDQEGHDVLVAHAPIPGTRWSLVIEDDWNTLVAPIQPYRNLLLGLVLVGMALPVAGVLWSSWRRRQPERWPWVGLGQDAADVVHQLLSPDRRPMLPGWSVAAHQEPSAAGPRDFHDFRLLADGRLQLALCRLPAEPTRAATTMATLRALSRSAALRGLTLQQACQEAEALLLPELEPGAPLALLWASLDPLTGRLEVVNPGRLAARLATTDAVLPITPPGGADASAVAEVTIRPGEAVLFHSLDPAILGGLTDGDPRARAEQADSADGANPAGSPVRAPGRDGRGGGPAGEGAVGEASARLDALFAGLAGPVEPADCRVDDLQGLLRSWPEHWRYAANGYLLIVVARDGPGPGAA
jgi:hypothetical protein